MPEPIDARRTKRAIGNAVKAEFERQGLERCGRPATWHKRVGDGHLIALIAQRGDSTTVWAGVCWEGATPFLFGVDDQPCDHAYASIQTRGVIRPRYTFGRWITSDEHLAEAVDDAVADTCDQLAYAAPLCDLPNALEHLLTQPFAYLSHRTGISELRRLKLAVWLAAELGDYRFPDLKRDVLAYMVDLYRPSDIQAEASRMDGLKFRTRPRS